MWSAGTERFDLYLGATDGALQRHGENLGVALHDHLQAAASHWFETVVRQSKRGWRSPSVRVWLSGRLARPLVFEPPQGLRRWSELGQLATALVQSEHPAEEGLPRVIVEGWEGSGAALAVACDGLLVDGIHGIAKQLGVSLASIRPWWASAMDRSEREAKDVRMLAARDTDALTVLATDAKNAWTIADTYDPAPDPVRFDQLLASPLKQKNRM